MFYPQKYSKERINAEFDELEKHYTGKTEWYRQQAIQEEEELLFLEQRRPKMREITNSINDLIKSAKSKIRLVQPYV